ncbi:unnamed protein product [Effrenium voratum]|uniref:Uncharacterized protein n=1 Tax=Effrenium voratum TaxID=2562239 RepID=A0AA36JDF8_9DINO|nr:unnamed protein product [Effrenium voratum]CAJ1403646.1 unnamed protein product [Effrenium voratum]CAJ1428082.1 unnamed protein product [Effrenium voratum]|mmetsp:Transcript_23632/g.56057  ORF Transcript_23632/g.56057 Transcript_23632/m.56057 type:complete len:154 (+) Transcript_23632:71-532(+)
MVCLPWSVPEMVQQVTRLIFRRAQAEVKHAPLTPVKRYHAESDDYDVTTAAVIEIPAQEVLRAKCRQINALLSRVEAGGERALLAHYLKVANELQGELQELRQSFAKPMEHCHSSSSMSTCESEADSADKSELPRRRSGSMESLSLDEWSMVN